MGVVVVKLVDDPDDDSYALYSTVVDDFISYANTRVETELFFREYLNNPSQRDLDRWFERAMKTGSSWLAPFDHWSWDDDPPSQRALYYDSKKWQLRDRKDLKNFLIALEHDDMETALSYCFVDIII